jgi:hypothetical protein
MMDSERSEQIVADKHAVEKVWMRGECKGEREAGEFLEPARPG